jgi:hypothetical protein
MGLISANLGLDCADCHPRAGTDQADFVIDTPRTQTTRRPVVRDSLFASAPHHDCQR